MNDSPKDDNNSSKASPATNMTARSKVMQNWSSSWHTITPVPVMPADESVRVSPPKKKLHHKTSSSGKSGGKSAKKTKENSQLLNVKSSAKSSNKPKTNKSFKHSNNNDTDYELKTNDSETIKSDNKDNSDSLDIYKNLRKRKSSSLLNASQITPQTNENINSNNNSTTEIVIASEDEHEIADPIARENVEIVDPITTTTDDKQEVMDATPESDNKQQQEITVMSKSGDKQEANEVADDGQQKNETGDSSAANLSIGEETRMDTEPQQTNTDIDCDATIMDESEPIATIDKPLCVICGKDVAKHALLENRFCSRTCAIAQWTHEFKIKWSKEYSS